MVVQNNAKQESRRTYANPMRLSITKSQIIFIFIILILLLELFLRLRGPSAYNTDKPHLNFQYDSNFAWVGKSNFMAKLESYGFENVPYDQRGFPILPQIVNDKIKNEKKILFIGKCDTFGGPIIGVENGFMSLLAQEASDLLDFDVIGQAGYSFYQEYLLNQKYNTGGNNLVLFSFCPFVDFYLNTEYFMHHFGNRRVPRPSIDGDTITHAPVPYIKSYWEYKLPWNERFSWQEKILLSSYLVSSIANQWIHKTSFDVDLTRRLVKELQRDVEQKSGKVALLIFDRCPDTPDPRLNRVTDEFITWLLQNNVGVIDVRKKLVGCSLAKFGDPTHINFEGQKIIKNEILSYLRKNDLLVN